MWTRMQRRSRLTSEFFQSYRYSCTSFFIIFSYNAVNSPIRGPNETSAHPQLLNWSLILSAKNDWLAHSPLGGPNAIESASPSRRRLRATYQKTVIHNCIKGSGSAISEGAYSCVSNYAKRSDPVQVNHIYILYFGVCELLSNFQRMMKHRLIHRLTTTRHCLAFDK